MFKFLKKKWVQVFLYFCFLVYIFPDVNNFFLFLFFLGAALIYFPSFRSFSLKNRFQFLNKTSIQLLLFFFVLVFIFPEVNNLFLLIFFVGAVLIYFRGRKSKQAKIYENDMLSDDFFERAASLSNYQFKGAFESAVLVDELALSQVTKQMISKGQFFKIYRKVEYKFKGDIYEDNKRVKKNVKYHAQVNVEKCFNLIGNIEGLGKSYNLDELEEIEVDPGKKPSKDQLNDLSLDTYLIDRGTYIDYINKNKNSVVYAERDSNTVRAGKKPKTKGSSTLFISALFMRIAHNLKMWPEKEPLSDEEKNNAHHEDFIDGIQVELYMVEKPK